MIINSQGIKERYTAIPRQCFHVAQTICKSDFSKSTLDYQSRRVQNTSHVLYRNNVAVMLRNQLSSIKLWYTSELFSNFVRLLLNSLQ